MKNDQKGCGCSSPVMVAVIGLIGIIFTGIFGLVGAIISREDIPLPFLSSLNNPTPLATPSPNINSQGSNTSIVDSPTPIPNTSVPAQSTIRSHMVLDGFTADSNSGATASYRLEIDAEGVVGSNYSGFSGLSTTVIQDVFGQFYTRQAYIEGDFNSGVLSLYDTGVLSEDFLPSGGFWCYMTLTASATDTQGSTFIGTYESTNPPCFGQVSLQVVSQTQLP